LIEIGLAQRERFLDAQPGPLEDHDQAAQAASVGVVAGGAHHGDELLDLRRIGRIAKAFVVRRLTGVEAGHGRRGTTSTGAVERQL
jgi:hypothetical protein